jgi:CRP-like cAMP-binding protein
LQTSDRTGGLVRTTIAQTRLFAGWPPHVLDAIAGGSELRSFKSGEAAIRMGEPSQHMVLVVTGAFRVQRTLKNGRTIVFDFLLPGQSTSHLALFDGIAPAFDIVAKTDARCVFISRETLLAAIGRDPDRLMDIIQFLCRRTRMDYEGTHLRIGNSLRCQIAKLLAYWARGPERPDAKGACVPFALSQDDLAAMLGCSRQTVNRELAELAKRGIVTQSYRKIEINDIPALMALMESEDPDRPGVTDAVFARPKNVLRASD